MSRTLIVPDIHEQIDKLWNIEETLMAQAARVVMLGDFFDSFRPAGQQRDCAQWVKDHLGDDKFTILWGNHDCHYAFKHPAYRCSGYSADTQRIVSEVLTPDDYRKVKISTKVGKFLVSHAGFHPNLMVFTDDEVQQDALDAALSGKHHPIWSAGWARGGAAIVGGPVWLDWNEEFEPVEGTPQIVGHTNGKAVRTKQLNSEISYCLDTSLHHVMWVDEETNEVEIVEV